ncbi:TolC family protein [Rufibacter aurantiacus]|uniref:TolC family protein n=1 Tax=Rufibacter aurantiacus TaxID=2817374 RepID=UPI001B30A38E|nr:TolC family protein [Rufibacter aurantiacus]
MNKYLLFFFLLAGGRATAQVTFGSLPEATTYALQHRPDLHNADLARQVAEQGAIRAKAPLYPQVKVSGAFDDYLALPVQLIPAEFVNGEKGELVAVQFGTQYNLAFHLEAALPLVSVQAWKNRRIAQAEVQYSYYQQQDAQQRASEEIARMYYLCLLNREATALSQENLHVNDTLLLTAAERFRNGLAEPLELNRLKALQLESRQQLNDNQTVYRKNLARLKMLCGIKLKEDLQLTETLSDQETAAPPPQPTVEALGLYRALQWRIQAAETEEQKQRLSWLPEVSMYGRFTQQAQRNAFNFTDSAYPWYQVGWVGLRAEWLLFSGFNRKAEFRRATLQKQMAVNELQHFALRAQEENEEINLSLQNAQSSLENYRQHYALYQENYTIARYKYHQDVYTVDQLLQVYTEKLKSQNFYLNAMADYYVNRALLQIKNHFAQPDNPALYVK